MIYDVNPASPHRGEEQAKVLAAICWPDLLQQDVQKFDRYWQHLVGHLLDPGLELDDDWPRMSPEMLRSYRTQRPETIKLVATNTSNRFNQLMMCARAARPFVAPLMPFDAPLLPRPLARLEHLTLRAVLDEVLPTKVDPANFQQKVFGRNKAVLHYGVALDLLLGSEGSLGHVLVTNTLFRAVALTKALAPAVASIQQLRIAPAAQLHIRLRESNPLIEDPRNIQPSS